MTNIVVFRPAPARPVPALNPSYYEPAEIVHVSWGAPAHPAPEPATETARNLCLRRQRNAAWETGMARVRYYAAALDMEHAITCAQNRELPEGRNHPRRDFEARLEILARYRAALAEQILRPASRLSEVEWKRRQIGLDTFKYCRLPDERAQRAIAEDMAFLADHPVRKTARALAVLS